MIGYIVWWSPTKKGAFAVEVDQVEFDDLVELFNKSNWGRTWTLIRY